MTSSRNAVMLASGAVAVMTYVSFSGLAPPEMITSPLRESVEPSVLMKLSYSSVVHFAAGP